MPPTIWISRSSEASAITELIFQDEILRAATEQSRLPVQHRNQFPIDFVAFRQEHAGDVEPFAGVVLREADQHLRALKIELRRVIVAQMRGQIFDDHRLVRIRDLTEDSARQSRQAIALPPGIEVLFESRRSRDEIERRGHVAARDRDVIVDAHQFADVFPINIDHLLGVADT